MHAPATSRAAFLFEPNQLQRRAYLCLNSKSKWQLWGAVIGGRIIVRNFHELGSLQTICDADGERAAEMGARHQVAGTSDFDSVLEDPVINAVALAVPAVRHYEFAKKAMLAGKDVFVREALALQDAREEKSWWR